MRYEQYSDDDEVALLLLHDERLRERVCLICVQMIYCVGRGS